jgi:hypothetical protein
VGLHLEEAEDSRVVIDDSGVVVEEERRKPLLSRSFSVTPGL